MQATTINDGRIRREIADSIALLRLAERDAGLMPRALSLAERTIRRAAAHCRAARAEGRR